MPGRWTHGTGRLVSDALVIQAGRALQVLLNVATFVMLARRLGPRDFGTFSTIVAVIAAGSGLADLGLGQLAVRAAAQHREQEVAGIRAVMSRLYAAAAAVLAVSCTISWGLTGVGPRAALGAALIGTSYLVTQARIGVERGLWLGALRVARATGVEVTAAGLRAIAVGVVWVTGAGSVLSFAWAIAGAGVATLIVVLRWLQYPVTLGDPIAGESKRHIIREAIPFGLSSLTWNGLAEIPKLLLASVAGPIAVGQYAAGARFLAAATLPLQSVLNVVTPRLFAAAATSDGNDARRGAFFKSILGVTALGTVFGLAMMGLAPLVPVLLGPEYAPAVPVLQMLGPSLAFQALAFAAGDWLGGMGRQTLRLVLTVATLTLAVPTLLLASRAFGALGAAGGYSALTGVLAVMTAFASWQSLRR
jgi:O-antigen/teichoic acid export membrane protein